jgi:hypothetical protein
MPTELSRLPESSMLGIIFASERRKKWEVGENSVVKIVLRILLG